MRVGAAVLISYVMDHANAPQDTKFQSPDHSRAGWVGHPDCQEGSDDCRRLIANRDRIEVISSWEEPNLEYEYHEEAIVRLDLAYYALTTTGCSCPSPTETWCIDYGPATLDEMRAWAALGPRADVWCPVLTNEALGVVS